MYFIFIFILFFFWGGGEFIHILVTDVNTISMHQHE